MRLSNHAIGLLFSICLSTSILLGQDQRAARRWRPGAMRTSVIVEGAMDSELLRPGLLAALGKSIFVFDYGDHAVKVFGDNGTLKWRFGRRGSGPAEFLNPIDLAISPDGNVWIADPPNSRITVLSPTGALLYMLSVRRDLERVVPLSRGEFFAVAYTNERPVFAYYDSAGRQRQLVAHPGWLDSIPSLVSELRLAYPPMRNWIAIGSYYSGRMMKTERAKSEIVELDVVERYPFPVPIVFSPRSGMTVRRFPPDARATVRSLAADDQSVFALVGSRLPRTKRVVDRYRISDGRYLESFVLPDEVEAIAMGSCGILLLFSDPLPALSCVAVVR